MIVVAQSNTGMYLGTDQTGSKYKVVVNGGTGASGSCAFQSISEGCAQSASIATGWHLVTGTYDGATAILYVDGVMIASDTFTAPASLNSSLKIGSGWNGALQSLRVYGRALTASEVAALYAQKGNLTLTKTADAAIVAATGSIGYTLSVGNPGSITAVSAVLNDPLPAGTGISWSISPAYSGPGTCAIASGTLTCNFGNLSAGGSASVHVASGTTAASCGVYPNTAAFSATSFATVQASATTTVQCGQTINFRALAHERGVRVGDSDAERDRDIESASYLQTDVGTLHVVDCHGDADWCGHVRISGNSGGEQRLHGSHAGKPKPHGHSRKPDDQFRGVAERGVWSNVAVTLSAATATTSGLPVAFNLVSGRTLATVATVTITRCRPAYSRRLRAAIRTIRQRLRSAQS